jgi:hypothetical protein
MDVMIFGVGKSGGLYKKRMQIREALNKMPGVTAYFPEQREFAKPFIDRFNIPKGDAVTLETVQAEAADVIIALEPGPGVAQEVAIFSRRESLAAKLFDLMPIDWKNTRRSFAGQLRTEVAKHYYTGSELKDCTLATKVVIQHVATKRIQKALL